MATAFHNHTAGQIVDELGSIKAQIADLKAREDALKAELIARGAAEAEGSLFRATISTAMRWTLDAERVKAEMGENWYTTRCKTSAVTSLRISARKGLAVAA
jgi:hypothetical protein